MPNLSNGTNLFHQNYTLTENLLRFTCLLEKFKKLTILLRSRIEIQVRFHITQKQRAQNGPSSFIPAFCKNCDSRPVGILAGKMSHQRLAFCLKKKKVLLMQKFLLFPLCGVWGRVGRGRLLSISVEHCNLKWVMQNINENVNLWDGGGGGQQILFLLRFNFLWQSWLAPNQGFSLDRHTPSYPDTEGHVQKKTIWRKRAPELKTLWLGSAGGQALGYLFNSAFFPLQEWYLPQLQLEGTPAIWER